MKTNEPNQPNQTWRIELGGATARSVIVCGSPLPLWICNAANQLLQGVIALNTRVWKSARRLEHSKTGRFIAAFQVTALLMASPARSQAEDCVTWVKRTDVGSYGQRMHHAMAYDTDRGVTVFFGGEIGAVGEEEYFNDTQEYDGKQWKQINTAVRPPTRSLHAMAYDPVRKQIVLYGGHRADGPAFGDTWLYTSDGVNGFWTKSEEGIGTIAGQAMVWNSQRQVVMMQGGVDRIFNPGGGFTLFGGPYEWNGQSWEAQSPTKPEEYGLAMAFDSLRNVALAYGGFGGLNENPELLNEHFHEYTAATGWVDRGPGPPKRAYAAMAYDERRQRFVMVGGVGDSPSVGEEAYEYIPGQGWIIIPPLPSGQGRAGAKMVYDSKRGVMVLTGGAGGGAPNAGSGGRYSDTWELWPSLFVSGQPSDATNLVCTTATFSVFVQGAGPFQYRWRRDGEPLTDDAHFSGSLTNELTINGLRHTHAGKYDVVVRDSCSPQNVVTSQVATLTVRPEIEWVLRATNGPPARFAHGMAYDNARHVTVLFGGQTNWGGPIPLNDLWEWDGAGWTQRVNDSVSNGWTYVPATGWHVAHTNGPVRRGHFAMAYDSRRGRIVMFGGRAVDPGGSAHFLRDLWEWDGTRWQFRSTNGPVPRYYCSMAYDERRGRTVLFGGQPVPAPGETADGELVWEWDGEQWHTVQPALNPSDLNYRAQSRMTYDSFRGVIVFGPTSENHSHWAFWDWDGVQWSIFPVLHYTDPIVTVLHGTSLGAFTFDANRRRSAWFGGLQLGPVNHTAFFDGKEWTLLTDSMVLPAGRVLPAMAYDSERRVHVMFGGSLTYGGAIGATNDTWELAAVDVPPINEHPISQYRLAGETAIFTVQAMGSVVLGYQWYHGNMPISGANSSTLTIPDVQPEDAGEYSVRISNACGDSWSRPALLTLNPRLQIFPSTDTMTLIWRPDPTVVLEVSDNVNGPWTIVSDPPNPFTVNGLDRAKFFRNRQLE